MEGIIVIELEVEHIELKPLNEATQSQSLMQRIAIINRNSVALCHAQGGSHD